MSKRSRFHGFLGVLSILLFPLFQVRGTSVGETAPEISAAGWINSSPLSMADTAGKVRVLEFWATW
jgi:hypothetical protein